MFYKRYCNKVVDLLKITKEAYYKKEKTGKNTGKTLEPCGVVSMKLYILRKAVKQFLHHLSQQKVKQYQTPKTLLRISITFLPALAKIFKKKSSQLKNNFLKDPITDTFFISPTTPEEVYKSIQELQVNKSLGPNSIPTKLLNLLKTLYQGHCLN